MLANAVFPEYASPAATATRLASAIPTLKNLSGNFFPKLAVFNESVVSAPKTTMFGSSSPTATSD